MKYIHDKVKNNETIYLHYDFEDVVVRLVPTGKNKYKSIAKFKGGGESEYPKNSDLIHETEMRGEIITKEQYDLYGLTEEEIEIEENSKNCNKTKQNESVEIVPPSKKEFVPPPKKEFVPPPKKKKLKEMTYEEMGKAIVELQLGRKPKNKEEEELLKEIRDAESKGYTIDLPLF